jgi:hypothetical protein
LYLMVTTHVFWRLQSTTNMQLISSHRLTMSGALII